jgi:iron-sulfur cluster assembly protein
MSATAKNIPAEPAGPAPSPSKREIEITQDAAAEITRQRAKRGTPDAMIRIGVRGGGCTGFTYLLVWA